MKLADVRAGLKLRLQEVNADVPRVYCAKMADGSWSVRLSVGALKRHLSPDAARKLAGELLAHADLAEAPGKAPQ